MKHPLQIISAVFKLLGGIILGLLLALLTIVLLEILLPKPNPFQKDQANLWLIGSIIAAWLFVILSLIFFKRPSQKIPANGTDQLPLSASELIDAIIDAMGYRRGERADVKQELTDHFTDALADCDDEPARQERIGELIKEFGDVELLGTLIRRGKKRCQPTWKKIITHIPHAVGLSVVLLLLYVGWFFTGKPQVTKDYLAVFNEQVRPTVDDSLNAWPDYEKAVDAYVKPLKIDPETNAFVTDSKTESSEELIELDTFPQNLNALSPQETRILERWLDDNEKTVELTLTGNQKPYYWRTYTGDSPQAPLMTLSLPPLGDLKKLAYLQCWHGLKEAQQEHFNAAFDYLFESYNIGRHLRGHHTTLVEQLVAISIQNASTQMMRQILSNDIGIIDIDTLRRIRQSYETLIQNETYLVSFEGDRLFLYDEAQRCFTQSRFGQSHLYLPRISQYLGHDKDQMLEFEYVIPQAFHILFSHPDKTDTLKSIDTFYDTLSSMAQKTPATLKAQNIDKEAYVQAIMSDNVFLQILMPAVTKLCDLSYRNQVDSQATLVVMGLLEYHKQYGHLPESLDELTDKQLLSAVPIDPFSDQPLRYKKSGDSFTLYSVGQNFTDNGGVPGTDDKGRLQRWGRNGDRIFWPVSEE